ncbi:MAG: SGNH/GDSL hydrolase family protein [Chitinophagaceae bacterium]
MHIKSFILFAVLLLFSCVIKAQEQTVYKWNNPAEAAFPVIDGRHWQTGLVNTYDRFPANAEATVRKEVFGLSHNSAGEYIRFQTNATEIVVRYKVKGGLAFPHMPSTGVSGVDLYAKDAKSNWHWMSGAYSFGDTITYRFTHLAGNWSNATFQLYLPLYNSIAWMEIGVAASNAFQFMPIDKGLPIVMYGTSILQGGCATRAGLAFTNMLGRNLDMPVINLGFSGNGRLEKPVIDLVNEINARLYVLDCMPNLVDPKLYPEDTIRERLINAVKAIQMQHQGIPIILAEHSCSLLGLNMDTSITGKYKRVSDATAKIYNELKKEGVTNIYLLTDNEIGFTIESTVDGTHPNDIGMKQYANAYEKLIRSILKMQKKGKGLQD